MKRLAAIAILWIIFLVSFLVFTDYVYGEAPPDFCVRVFVDDGDSWSMGSGVLISADRIVTNYHVVRDRESDTSVLILFVDWEIVHGKVLHTDKEADLALIAIPPQPDRTVVVLGTPAEKGKVLQIHGYGRGLPGSAFGIMGRIGEPLLVIGAKPRLGDSGGPILNFDGELVGVLYGYLGKTTYGTGIAIVKEFIKEK